MLFLLIAQLALAQNLIRNGGFSKNGCGDSLCYSNDDQDIAPWTVISAQKTFQINPPRTLLPGINDTSIDLNSNGQDPTVVIQQNVQTVIGDKYIVTFNLNQNPRCGLTSKTGFVMASGGSHQAFETSDDKTREVKYSFIATQDQTALVLGSTTYGISCGPVVFGIKMSKNLIYNGDFSKNGCSPTESSCHSSNSADIAPWEVISPKPAYGIFLPSVFGLPSNAMDLNSNSETPKVIIRQYVDTVIGGWYKVSFSLNQNTNCGGVSTKTGIVYAFGGNNAVFQTSSNITKQVNYYFKAVVDKTELQLASTTAGICGPLIFDIGMVCLNDHSSQGSVAHASLDY
jgi:Protein of unknown function (DUF642)